MNDGYLVNHMNNELYVPIAVVAEFAKIKALTADMAELVAAMKATDAVVVDETTMRVRPNFAAQQRTTLILRDIPSDADVEEVAALLLANGMPAVKTIRPDIGNTWFVTFSDEEDTLTMFEYVRTLEWHGQPIGVRIKSEHLLKSVHERDEKLLEANQEAVKSDVKLPPGYIPPTSASMATNTEAATTSLQAPSNGGPAADQPATMVVSGMAPAFYYGHASASQDYYHPMLAATSYAGPTDYGASGRMYGGAGAAMLAQGGAYVPFGGQGGGFQHQQRYYQGGYRRYQNYNSHHYGGNGGGYGKSYGAQAEAKAGGTYGSSGDTKLGGYGQVGGEAGGKTGGYNSSSSSSAIVGANVGPQGSSQGGAQGQAALYGGGHQTHRYGGAHQQSAMHRPGHQGARQHQQRVSGPSNRRYHGNHHHNQHHHHHQHHQGGGKYNSSVATYNPDNFPALSPSPTPNQGVLTNTSTDFSSSTTTMTAASHTSKAYSVVAAESASRESSPLSHVVQPSNVALPKGTETPEKIEKGEKSVKGAKSERSDTSVDTSHAVSQKVEPKRPVVTGSVNATEESLASELTGLTIKPATHPSSSEAASCTAAASSSRSASSCSSPSPSLSKQVSPSGKVSYADALKKPPSSSTAATANGIHGSKKSSLPPAAKEVKA